MIGDLGATDATELAGLVAKGDVTPGELLDAALAAVEARNPAINAVVLLNEPAARRAIAEGLPHGPFRGVPFLIKDLGIEARDFPSHNGSRLLANTTYPGDSAIFTRIKASGVVTFGRTTSPEGGIGAATESAVYGGPTRNPWNLDHTSGGSSGGAGAAVAAGIVAFAHGSDGGGSVRIPAASCGLFGFKPTRARLPDGPYAGEGWAGMAIDGFLTRSVRDTATMLDACEGADLGAPYWAPPLAKGHAQAISRPPRRLRVALCDTSLTGDPIDPQVRDAVHAAARLLESLGHHVEPGRPSADVPMMMRAWTDIVAVGTALGIRSALKGRPLTGDLVEGVGRGALAHAETLHPTRYLQAVGEIHAFGRQMAGYFDTGPDILLSATLAEPPARIGRFSHATEDYVAYRTGPEGIFAYSPFCAVFNASGQPAASLPLAMSAQGLPIGIHLAAPFGADEELIALCAEIERAAPWASRRAPMADP
ncbi:MAG: amidase family protein [Tabrizicola sp.]|uniref:amidase n=1 Tax=Tabrizicola sp. TaxID=2005166 RepID=UPI0027376EB1|nr:amidase family protein [Tabrizicola sp.]MDP3263791.1 amidase family protein [Tabrizicola sp.]MDP3647155.1 amidase family protein [Paracoccaceae bacterium]MDZ4067969.1 amidase family protein [Tabrizicola sp.]